MSRSFLRLLIRENKMFGKGEFGRRKKDVRNGFGRNQANTAKGKDH